MKKKILIMAAHFHPYKGGLENFALDLSTKLAKKGIEVDVLTFNVQGNKEKEKYKGITIHRLPSLSILGNTYTLPKINNKYKKILSGILSKKYDAIFTNTRFFTTSYLGLKYSKKIKKINPSAKFIHIEHGNVHVIHKNPIVTFIAWLYDKTAGRKIFKGADLVVGISTPCANFAKKHGAKRTKVIHNSIDVANFYNINSKKTSLRKKLKIPKDNLVILNGIGRLIYAKGLHDTLEAVKGMKAVTVITIGDGPFENNLKDLAKKYKVKAIFPGRLTREEIVDYLGISDMFVNPSYSEGLPTCILEAGASGLPVIATNVGGTKEIITKKEEGILIKPKDVTELRKQIIELKDLKKRTQYGKEIQKKIMKDFDWEKNIDAFRKLI